jgi:zinc transport system substrate-binding protein
MRPLALLLCGLLATSPAAAAPRVVASILPVHGIVSAVMADVGAPELLLSGRRSEHAASFTPAQLAALGEADLVFIVGRGLEAKLAQLSGSEAVNGRTFVALADAAGVGRLLIREGGAFEPHSHEKHKEDDPATFDPHVWLDPENAKAMAWAAAVDLSRADPAHGAAYAANARAFAATLDRTSAAIAAELAPVRHKPFIVFHDAYRYFEARFGLTAAGSITDVAAAAPSARRLQEIRERLTAAGAVCVFGEPQFDDRYVGTVVEGTQARTGVLDGLGADLEPGAHAYPQLLRNLSAAFRECLEG